MATQSKSKIKKVKVNVHISRDIDKVVTFIPRPRGVVARAPGKERIVVRPNPMGKGFAGFCKSQGTWTASTPAKAFARTVKNCWA